LEEENPAIMEVVQTEVTKGDGVIALPKLNMVQQIDITRWFRKYKIIAPDLETREALMQQHFKDIPELQMDKVQIELKKLIDRHNDI